MFNVFRVSLRTSERVVNRSPDRAISKCQAGPYVSGLTTYCPRVSRGLGQNFRVVLQCSGRGVLEGRRGEYDLIDREPVFSYLDSDGVGA